MGFSKYLMNGFFKDLAYDSTFLRSKIMCFIFNSIPDFFVLRFLRNIFLRLGGAHLDFRKVYVKSPFWCTRLTGLKLGDGTFLNMGVRVDGSCTVEFGMHCKVGPFAIFENVNHLKKSDKNLLPIIIEDNVWIGARAIVLPGAKIRSGAIIASGAVVGNKVIPSDEVWGGVPARFIKVATKLQNE